MILMLINWAYIMFDMLLGYNHDEEAPYNWA